MECIVNLNLSEYLLLFQILGVYLGVEFQTHPIMNIKRNIIFALESRKKSGVPIVENVPIRMRVIYASQRIEFTTGYRIDVAKWDSDKQRVKNGCTNKLKQSASEINADLLKYYAEIQNVFKEFEVQETMPTTQQLKDAFNLRMKNTNEEQQEEARISFWEVFDEFVKECGNQNNWTESTYEKFAAVYLQLLEISKRLNPSRHYPNRPGSFLKELHKKGLLLAEDRFDKEKPEHRNYRVPYPFWTGSKFDDRSRKVIVFRLTPQLKSSLEKMLKPKPSNKNSSQDARKNTKEIPTPFYEQSWLTDLSEANVKRCASILCKLF